MEPQRYIHICSPSRCLSGKPDDNLQAVLLLHQLQRYWVPTKA